MTKLSRVKTFTVLWIFSKPWVFLTNFYKFCCQDKSRWRFLNTSTRRRQVADNYRILVKKLSLKYTEEANKETVYIPVPWIVLKTNTRPESHCSQTHWLIVAELTAEHSVVKVIRWFSKELLQRALLYMTKPSREKTLLDLWQTTNVFSTLCEPIN